MYISAKVPPMEALGSDFVYVNVAYYDNDEKKFTETAKVVPEAPPQEGAWSNWQGESLEQLAGEAWSNWQVDTSQGARGYPASRPGPGGTASSYYEWKPKAAVKPEPAIHKSLWDFIFSLFSLLLRYYSRIHKRNIKVMRSKIYRL